jgi:hypothetical protein
MIRQEWPATGATPARFCLINQIDHARVSADLARHWGGDGCVPPEPRDELLWAIEHHDDGWRDWDRAPGVDPKSGKPRAFTEMAIDDGIAIWSGSIDGAAAAGRLQGYVVAGHFCVLARRAAAFHAQDPAWPRAEAFLAKYEASRNRWLAEWQAADPRTNTAELAEQALRQLQFFDLLSLWFCCQPALEQDVLETPGGVELTLTPLDGQRVQISPWPLSIETLQLSVPARLIPAKHYTSREELAEAPTEQTDFRWEISQKTA